MRFRSFSHILHLGAESQIATGGVMSISSVNSSAQTSQLNGGNASGTSASSGAAATSTSSNTPESSSVVTLSPDARALAAAAAAGISVGQVSLAGLGFSTSEPMAEQIAQLQQAAKTLPTEALQNPDTGVSQAAFDKLVAQFGGTTQQAAELFQGFDTNGDGSISNAEFEAGLANALKSPSSPFAQALFGLMNTDGTGSISASEFNSFETAFLQGETSLPQSS
jgi:hypothetical protein